MIVYSVFVSLFCSKRGKGEKLQTPLTAPPLPHHITDVPTTPDKR